MNHAAGFTTFDADTNTTFQSWSADIFRRLSFPVTSSSILAAASSVFGARKDNDPAGAADRSLMRHRWPSPVPPVARGGNARRTVMASLYAAVFVATTAQATDKPAGPPYRLTLADGSSFRLGQTGDFRLAAAYRPAEPVSSALAGKPYAGEIERAARAQGLESALVHAVIDIESRHNANAVSPKGAIGLMQVMPGTAARFGKPAQLAAVDENLRVGTHYLKELVERYDQRLDLALAAYNAGEGAVARFGNRIPPFAETRQYVPAVLARYREWKTPAVATRPEYLAGTRLEPAWQAKPITISAAAESDSRTAD